MERNQRDTSDVRIRRTMDLIQEFVRSETGPGLMGACTEFCCSLGLLSSENEVLLRTRLVTASNVHNAQVDAETKAASQHGRDSRPTAKKLHWAGTHTEPRLTAWEVMKSMADGAVCFGDIPDIARSSLSVHSRDTVVVFVTGLSELRDDILSTVLRALSDTQLAEHRAGRPFFFVLVTGNPARLSSAIRIGAVKRACSFI